MSLETGEPVGYTGAVTAHFKLSQPDDGLGLDFGGGKVTAMSVNGAAVTDVGYSGAFIPLSKGLLKAGQNEVHVEFQHGYSTSGSGLYRFEDPEDHKVYVYTDFEPFDANQLFPCFDQPDLKATYQLTVEAPSAWVVVSSNKEASSEGDARKTWKFPETPKFSTYVFSLHAGPYKVWTADEPAPSPGGQPIPLRLFARQSLAKYVHPDDWFTVTRQGLAFYQEYFGVPYAFGKYDQLIVPDFNSGAMENVAAVTFSERYIKRGASTREDRENIAEVVLHEMAHMWFGDLVTMRWWDDLWLNESFATYMSYMACSEATEFTDMWQGFFDDTKSWAYWEDQLVTTHPIVGEVPSTAQAFANFDGITYGKGASVLKQLSFLLGAPKFREGVRDYMRKHAFQNAVMNDFMESLSTASGVPLGAWTQSWLKTAGLNTVTVDYACKDGKIVRFSLNQSAPSEHPLQREHRTQVALYGRDGDHMVMKRAHQITYHAESTPVPHLLGLDCPEMVLPNQGDFDYAKTRLDPETLKAIKKDLGKLDEPLTRMMAWRALWDMVLDAELPPLEFSEMALGFIPTEPEIRVQRSVSEHFVEVLHYLPLRGSADRVLRDTYVEKVEKFLWDRLAQAPGGTDQQKLWFDRFVAFARSQDGIQKLLGLLDGRLRVRGMDLDQDRRWALVAQVCEFDAEKGRPWIAKEQAHDPSENGAKWALFAAVVQPDLKVKQEWIQNVLGDKAPTIPQARVRSVLRGLFRPSQPELVDQLAQRVLDGIPALNKARDEVFLGTLGRYAMPVSCAEASNRRMQQFLDHHGSELLPVLLKDAKVSLQEDERCVRIRARQAQATQTASNEGTH
jgi:aminopeptidase N